MCKTRGRGAAVDAQMSGLVDPVGEYRVVREGDGIARQSKWVGARVRGRPACGKRDKTKKCERAEDIGECKERRIYRIRVRCNACANIDYSSIGTPALAIGNSYLIFNLRAPWNRMASWPRATWRTGHVWAIRFSETNTSRSAIWAAFRFTSPRFLVLAYVAAMVALSLLSGGQCGRCSPIISSYENATDSARIFSSGVL